MSTTASPAADRVAGGWVTDRFGVTLAGRAGQSSWTVHDLVVLGLRRNRRRAHLLVSTVLGKHIPTAPSRVRAAADDLGDAVINLLGADLAPRSTVLGFAETATGLGHCVAHRLSARMYLHSTRRAVEGASVYGTFEEGHSHATTHLLLPSSPELLALDPDAPLVLVDDEISTGSTALRAIASLQQIAARTHYVVASLVDMRTDAHRAETARAAAELGVRIDYVALADGRVELPDGLLESVWAATADPLNPVGTHRGRVDELHLPWPGGVPDGGRHGFAHSDTAPFDLAVGIAAAEVLGALDPERETVVVGHEELMYLPLCLAEHLERAGVPTRYQTTTRSPAQVRDVDGYPLRRGFTFTAPESDPTTPRFVYNLLAPDAPDRTPAVLPTVVMVIDRPADTELLRAEGGLLDVLTAAGHDVCLAILPTGGAAR
ncbi:phosphoribosyltransferase family protein [Gordonia sp. DT30]|uniref:phosphoribosyltransferase family protein n=1 Tax=Gordonia sp. DT30 TaxID=3416546 RepID=UPI003CEC53DB